jgi:hypothetical protein
LHLKNNLFFPFANPTEQNHLAKNPFKDKKFFSNGLKKPCKKAMKKP